MKHAHKIATILFFAFAAASFAKAAGPHVSFPGGKCWVFRLALTDKKGTPYSIDKPEKYLSKKAIERRQRQHLGIDSTDLPINPAYIKRIDAAGLKVVGKSKWNNTVLVRLADSAKISIAAKLPFVKSAKLVFTSPDSIFESERANIEPDTTTASTTHLYGDAEAQIKTLNGIRLHDAGFRGKGMTIAIIDGGYMNADRISLLKNVKINGTRNFTCFETKGVFDELDHGTAVLSCIGANQPGRIVGTAPEASFWLLRSEYGPTESEIEEDFWSAAAEFADSVGVDVINSSLGYNEFDDASTSHTYRQLDGHTAIISCTASLLAQKGIVLTNSAGNEGGKTWKKIGVPADACDIITVGAMDRDSVNTTFSSVGPSADGRVKPDVMAVGSYCTLIKGNGRITHANGTSFSSPVTCGMVACLWQAFPNLTALQIIDVVRRSADRYDHPDNIYGYGIPDFWKAYQIAKSISE